MGTGHLVRFYADENVPKRSVTRLRNAGHEVLYVVERTRSLRDRTIAHAAFAANALILTQDKDYRRILLVEKQPALGAVWIRLSGMPRALRAGRVVEVIQSYQSELLYHFTTIYPDRVEQEALEQPGAR